MLHDSAVLLEVYHAAKEGKPIVVTDDESRENEGDFIMAGESLGERGEDRWEEISYEQAMDEIVTVIDRDWGAGDGWRTLGFTPLKKLPPVTFFVGPDGLRCHPGVGPNPHRRRLPPQILDALAASGEQAAADDDDSDEAEAATERFLAARGYFAVRDAGAERHLKMVTPVTETVD